MKFKESYHSRRADILFSVLHFKTSRAIILFKNISPLKIIFHWAEIFRVKGGKIDPAVFRKFFFYGVLSLMPFYIY